MEIGVFSRTYLTGDLQETLRRMTGHGIRHTQLNLSNAGLPTLPKEVSDEDLERIRRLTSAHGVHLDALSGTFNMIDPDEEARRRGCEQFAVQCRIARELNIPIVSLCTGSKHPKNKWAWHDDNLKESSWDDLMRSTEVIIRHAEDNKLVLGVEPEVSNIINTPQRARRYLDETGSPYLKIIMDGANLFHPDQVPDMDLVLKESFELLGKDIALAHAKDFTVEDGLRFVAAGQGVLDYALYMRLLGHYGYQGALVMHGLSEEQVPAGKQFLEKVLESQKRI